MPATANLTLILSIIGIIILISLVVKARKAKPTITEPAPLNEEPQEDKHKPETEAIAETVVAAVPDVDSDIPSHIAEQRPLPTLNIEKTGDEQPNSLLEQFGKYDHTLDLASYKYPPLDLLDYNNSQINIDADQLSLNKNKIIATLNNGHIEVDAIRATIGPILS